MALSIGTNSASMAAQRSLLSSQNSLQTSFERLSSGSRINSAADDAAGLSISSRLKAQASGLQVAQRNAANGISLVETADAAMSTMTDLLTRARDLVLQRTDGTLSSDDVGAIDAEITDINTELERIRTNTDFAGTAILNGLNANISVDADGTTVNVALTVAAFSITAGTTDVGNIDDQLDVVSDHRADMGALANTFSATIENLAAIEQGVSAAAGRISDTDYARESGELAKNQILQQAGTAILAQANQSTQSVLSLLQ
ncbi:MAG: flagellin [Litorivicinus sp.]